MKRLEKSERIMETQLSLNAEELGGTIAPEKHKTWSEWLKENKKEILIGAGILAVTVAGTILVIKNKDLICREFAALQKLAKQPVSKFTIIPTGQGAKPAPESVMKAAPKQAMRVVTPEPIQEVVKLVPLEPKAYSFPVSAHIRTLPETCHPSPEKVAEALSMGFQLLDGQTWVKDYMKGAATA